METQALSSDLAQRNSEAFSQNPTQVTLNDPRESDSACFSASLRCYFCGYSKHPRAKCPARDASCHKCQKKGHFSKVCRASGAMKEHAASTELTKCDNSLLQAAPTLASSMSARAGVGLRSAVTEITVCGKTFDCLIDSGSTSSFVHPKLVDTLSLRVRPSSYSVSMASTSHEVKTLGSCDVNFVIQGQLYENFTLSIMPELCTDVVLGQDFQKCHEAVTVKYGGERPALVVCGFSTLRIDPPELFSNLASDCHPIATRSRRFGASERQFIEEETQRLLREGVIEPSNSPWRAQVVVVNNRSKRRLAIDYSQTINKFTFLDAYPLPRISEFVNRIACYRFFSTIDLKSAYHQIPIREADRPYTAFEAAGSLFHFTRLPFGVTNGVACFQRIMDSIIKSANLDGTFSYLDDVIICGMTQQDHDLNLKRFLQAAAEVNIQYNKEKCVFSTQRLQILGHVIENGELRPDPSRLKPLHDLPEPTDTKSLKRILGLFAHYSKWISDFSSKVKPLASVSKFPLSPDAQRAFRSLKCDIEHSVVDAIDESKPFEVETDASDTAIAATLCQDGRPVCFFSRMFQGSEVRHAAVEKEAQAIIEAIRHWRQFLTGRRFSLKTDQRSVSFIFDKGHKGKIKNDKIFRWRMELSCYDFDIIYRPGRENVVADTFSRSVCASSVKDIDTLRELHRVLCHPGVRRMFHFIRSKNLPYSLEEIRAVTKTCDTCLRCKPSFLRPPDGVLIKATQPFERLNLDFKGPLPSTNQNLSLIHI